MKTIAQDEFEALLSRMINAPPLKHEDEKLAPKKPPSKVLKEPEKDDLANGRTRLM